MTILKEIEREKQQLARCEKSLALEKLAKRKAETRRKIELGGLVVKSGLNAFNKAVILGVLSHGLGLIEEDENYLTFFESVGTKAFLTG